MLCVGLDEISESEGLDRTHMRMPQAQIELIEKVSAVNKKCGGCPICRISVEMPWADRVAAIVHGYLGGQAGASAMLDVLTGATCPSGKLNETYAYSLEDVASTSYYPAIERSSDTVKDFTWDTAILTRLELRCDSHSALGSVIRRLPTVI